jgi:hypothetical protein
VQHASSWLSITETQMSNTPHEYNEQEVYVRNGINAAVTKYHFDSASRGWWTDADMEKLKEIDPVLHSKIEVYVLTTKIALIHSEISEGLEGLRKDKMDEHLPKFTSLEVELADALIRIFDLAGKMKLRLGEATVEKGRYNMIRADHLIANRLAAGGKKF